MAEYSYNRQYELVVSQPFKDVTYNPSEDYTSSPLQDTSMVFSGSDDYRSVNKKRNVTVNDLHIDVNIDSNSTSSGSKGTSAIIKVYNLSSDSRAIIANVNNYVTLSGGYVGSTLDGLFTGQVSSCYTERQGDDLVTTLHCKDGYTPSNAIQISYYKKKGSTYASVMQDFAKIWQDNGVSIGELSINEPSIVAPIPVDNPTDTQLERSYVFSGYLRKAMDNWCTALNYQWQVVNNELYVEPKFNKNRVTVVNVSTDNMISINEKVSGLKTTSSSTNAKGLTITLLLDGRITTSKKIRVEDGDYKGTYTIDTVGHRLQYEGQNWYTVVECSGNKDEG